MKSASQIRKSITLSCSLPIIISLSICEQMICFFKITTIFSIWLHGMILFLSGCVSSHFVQVHSLLTLIFHLSKQTCLFLSTLDLSKYSYQTYWIPYYKAVFQDTLWTGFKIIQYYSFTALKSHKINISICHHESVILIPSFYTQCLFCLKCLLISVVEGIRFLDSDHSKG